MLELSLHASYHLLYLFKSLWAVCAERFCIQVHYLCPQTLCILELVFSIGSSPHAELDHLDFSLKAHTLHAILSALSASQHCLHVLLLCFSVRLDVALRVRVPLLNYALFIAAYSICKVSFSLSKLLPCLHFFIKHTLSVIYCAYDILFSCNFFFNDFPLLCQLFELLYCLCCLIALRQAKLTS